MFFLCNCSIMEAKLQNFPASPVLWHGVILHFVSCVPYVLYSYPCHFGQTCCLHCHVMWHSPFGPYCSWASIKCFLIQCLLIFPLNTWSYSMLVCCSTTFSMVLVCACYHDYLDFCVFTRRMYNTKRDRQT